MLLPPRSYVSSFASSGRGGREDERVRMGRFMKERFMVRSSAELRSSSACWGLRLGTSQVSSAAPPDGASSSLRLFSPPQVKWEQQKIKPGGSRWLCEELSLRLLQAHHGAQSRAQRSLLSVAASPGLHNPTEP